MSRQELVGTYSVDIVAMFFGMPMALFPALADELGGAGVLGLLYAAPAVGRALATLTSGWTARVHRHGLAVMLRGRGVGARRSSSSASPRALRSRCAGLVIAGGADMVSGIFRGTIWNQTIPDRLRGRLAGIEQVSYSTGPLLGNVEAGRRRVARRRARVDRLRRRALRRRRGIVALLLPGFRRYDARRTTIDNPSAAS